MVTVYNVPTWILGSSPSDLQTGLRLLIPSQLDLEVQPINVKYRKWSFHYGLQPKKHLKGKLALSNNEVSGTICVLKTHHVFKVLVQESTGGPDWMFLQEHLAEHHTSVTKTFKAKKSNSLLKLIFLCFLQIDLIQTRGSSSKNNWIKICQLKMIPSKTIREYEH